MLSNKKFLVVVFYKRFRLFPQIALASWGSHYMGYACPQPVQGYTGATNSVDAVSKLPNHIVLLIPEDAAKLTCARSLRGRRSVHG